MRSRDSRPWSLAGRLLAALALTVAFAACGDDESEIGDRVEDIIGDDTAGDGGGTDPGGGTEATDPPATDPPATDPPATEAPDTGGDEGGDSGDGGGAGDGIDIVESDGDGVDWGQIFLIGGIVLAIIVVLLLLYRLLAGRSREQRAAAARIAHLTGGARWVHDESSLELMSGAPSPDRLRTAWMDTRRRVNDLASEASEMATTRRGDEATSLQRLSSALMALQGALDTHVELRLQESGDPNAPLVLRESGVAVNDRRQELRAAITALTPR